MAALLQNYSISILSLPVYHLLTLIPHLYAVAKATSHLPSKQWDNRNPRSSTLKTNLQKHMPPSEFATYERAEAASSNGFENLPLFAASLVLGHYAGLGEETMNKFAIGVLVTRAVYGVVYVKGVNQGWAAVRSSAFFVQTGMCWWVLIRAAKGLVGK